MPKYFKFEAVGCLVFNKTTNKLFSDPDSQVPVNEDELPDHLSDDDDDARLSHNTRAAVVMPTPEKLIKPDKSKEMALKAAEANRKKKESENENRGPLTEANIANELHKHATDNFIEFPVSIGLSGHVFNTGNIVVANEAEKEPAFLDTIDN